jgi:hypothetical protein
MFNNDTVERDNEDDEDEGILIPNRSESILFAIRKAGHIIYIE